MKRSQATAQRRGSGPVPLKRLPKTPQTPARKFSLTEKHEIERDEDDSPSKAPVRYITELLIKQTTGKENLNDVLSLRLSVRKDDGKKIRYIENLEGLKRLQVLNLSFNQIQKMEKLGSLIRLRELDLSCNCIGRIEGLETLLHLQFLNLSHNLIESIPAWLGKKLRALRELSIEGNLLFSLTDISRLRPLKDLITLNLSSNPLSDLAHYRLYAVFHLRTVGQLDGAQVTEEERHQSDERFGQEEIENLEVELEARDKRFQALEADHSTTLDEKKKTENQAQALKKKTFENKEKIQELEDELKAKDELLRRKTAELTKACEKQFRLEQELAFHKIDAKFEPLPDAAFLDQMDGGTEESAYLGRATYRRNEFASEQILTPRSQQLGYHHTPQGGQFHDSVRRQLNETLDTTLADKEKEIAKAEERLKNLHKQVADSEDQVRILNDKILRAGRERDAKPPMEDEERFRLEGQLSDRLQAVMGLRDRVGQLEDSMQATLDIIEAKDKEMAGLRQQLDLLQEGDPRYPELEAQLADRELQAQHASRNYANLKHDLDNTLGRLTAEMDRVKGLEQQLAEGQADLNDELRQELQGIVGGLTEYLAQVKGQVADQQRENARLHQERRELLEKLERKEREKEEEKQREVNALKQQLRDAEDAIQEFEADNEALRKSQREMSKAEPERDATLREALEEAKRLKDALRRQQRQAEAEKTALEEELAARRDEAQRAVGQARSAGDKDAETRAIAKQLAEAQAANRALRDRLRDQQVQYDELMNSSLFPEEVAERINHVGEALEASRGDDSLPFDALESPGPRGEGDVVGTSLAGLQGQVLGRLKDVREEADRAKRYQQKAEGEARSLRHQLEEMQGRLRDMAERDRKHGQQPDTDREDEKEMERMREELRKLREALKKQKPPRPQQLPATRSDTRSVAPVPDPRVTEQMQRLHGDLNDLRNQLKHNDGVAAQQMADAEEEVAKLRGELQRRDYEAQERARAQARALQQQAREAERQQASAVAQAERQAGALAQKAVDELAKAQTQIENLEDLLADKERDLENTLHQGETATQAVADQQEEIAALHDVLEAQRDEIVRLQDLVQGLGRGQDPGSPQAAADLENLLGEIGALRQALQGQQAHMAGTGPGRGTNIPPFARSAGPGHGFKEGAPYGAAGDHFVLPMHPAPSAPLNQTNGSMAPQSFSHRPIPVSPGTLGANGHPSFRNVPTDPVQYVQAPPVHPQTHSLAPPVQVPTRVPAPSMQPQMQNTVPSVQPVIPPVQSQMHSTVPMVPTTQVNVPLQGTNIPVVGTNTPMGGTVSGPGGDMSGQNGAFVGHVNALGGDALYQSHGTSAPTEVQGHQQRNGADYTISGSRRGKLRRVEGLVDGLFCNVPEHHDMEDEIDRLRKRLEKLKRTNAQLQSDRKSSRISGSGSRIRQDLLDKRDELDALDLAVSRQQGTLRRLREDDEDLRHQKEAKLRELHELDRAVSERRNRRDFLDGRRRFQPQDVDYELVNDDQLLHRSGFLEDEIECLEDTIAKRKAELREADRLLLQCQTDLHDAQDKASHTLREYDVAARNLALTREEREELERRTQELAIELVKAQEQLRTAQEEAEELEERRRRHAQEAGEMEELLSRRETDLRAVEAKRDQSSKRLEKLKSEVVIAEQKLSELQSLLRDGERDRANRQSELDRLQDQLDNQNHILAEVNRDIGSKQSELQTLTLEVDKHRNHLVSALEEGEREISATQQQIKDTKAQLDRLKQQRSETAQAVDQRRDELSHLHDKISAAEGVLRDCQSSIEKQRAELKHTLEMVHIEKTELEALRLQHEAKMAELEKTQLTALQEKVSLEKLQEDAQKSRASSEVMREEMRRVKEERDGMVAEQRLLEESIGRLSRDEDTLKQNCNSLENKLGQLKKTHGEAQENLYLVQQRLEGVQQDVVSMETALNDATRRKDGMMREANNLKQHIKENKSELKHTKADLEEAEQQQTMLKEVIERQIKQKAELSAEVDQMKEGLDQHRTTLEDCQREERTRRDVLGMLGRELDSKEEELRDRRSEFEGVERRLAQEKDKLSKLVERTSRETEESRANQDVQQRELDSLIRRKESLESKVTKSVGDLGTIDELQTKMKNLEEELNLREGERKRLKEELDLTKEQISEGEQEKGRLESEKRRVECEMKQFKSKWNYAQKDFKTEHRRLTQEIENLKVSLDEETKHTSRMGKEVDMWRQEYLNIKQQLHSHEHILDRENKMDSQLQHLKEEIQSEVNEGLRALELSKLEVLDELQEVHHQKAEISKKIAGLKEVKLTSFQAEKENSLRKQLDIEFQLQQEQDLLKLQLEQQMSRQSEVLAGIKMKSESTINSLRTKLDDLEDLVSGSTSHSLSIRVSRRITENLERSVDLIPLRDDGPQRDRDAAMDSSMDSASDTQNDHMMDRRGRELTKQRTTERRDDPHESNHHQRPQVEDVDLTLNELQTQDFGAQRTQDRDVERTLNFGMQRTGDDDVDRILDFDTRRSRDMNIRRTLDLDIRRTRNTTNIGRVVTDRETESSRNMETQKTQDRVVSKTFEAEQSRTHKTEGSRKLEDLNGRVTFDDDAAFRDEKRTARRDRSEQQLRGILKKRSAPSGVEGGQGDRKTVEREARGRGRLEDRLAPPADRESSQLPSSHSYRRQRRHSPSPTRQPERGPPSSQHWSNFMDSVNQLKDQKLAQLNTNTWDSR